MKNKTKNKEKGFIKLITIIVVIVVILLLMRYFNITISGILDYFHISWTEIISWFKKALDWFKDLLISVK